MLRPKPAFHEHLGKAPASRAPLAYAKPLLGKTLILHFILNNFNPFTLTRAKGPHISGQPHALSVRRLPIVGKKQVVDKENQRFYDQVLSSYRRVA